MNAWGFVLIVLGVILIVIGIKGSQHEILGILHNVHLNPNAAPAGPPAGSGSTGTSQGQGTHTAGGRG